MQVPTELTHEFSVAHGVRRRGDHHTIRQIHPGSIPRPARMSASQSSMWIQLNHWRPSPSEPPRKARATPTIRANAGDSVSRTIDVRTTLSRPAFASATASSHGRATPVICGRPGSGSAVPSVQRSSPASLQIAVVLAWIQHATGRSADACTRARVASTRLDVRAAMFAAVGRQSTSFPARLITAVSGCSRTAAHGPTRRPSQVTCGCGMSPRIERVTMVTSWPRQVRSAAIRRPREPLPPAITTWSRRSARGGPARRARRARFSSAWAANRRPIRRS